MDEQQIIEAFDEAKDLLWNDDDEYIIGYNNGIEHGKMLALTMFRELLEKEYCEKQSDYWRKHCEYLITRLDPKEKDNENIKNRN